MRSWVVRLALMLATIGVAGCASEITEAPSPRKTLVTRERLEMGSSLQLSAWTADEAGAVAAFEAVFAEFERLDRLMSVWHPDSDIEKLNRAAGLMPVEVRPETLDVLLQAREAGDLTDGKFDVTFGALSGLWKFDQDQDNVIPSRADVHARLPLVNYRDLTIDTARKTAFLSRPGMRAHLGGIGKGYAVDRGAAILRGRGFRDFLIQSGGDMFVSGLRGDRPWRLGIRDPRGPEDKSFAALDLSDGTFSTSGDYERFFIKDGTRYHHILDPDRGEPARLCRSVTIVADRAVIADVLSTGVFVLGPEKGMALIERLPNVEGVVVAADNRVLVSSGLKGRLTVLGAPTDAP